MQSTPYIFSAITSYKMTNQIFVSVGRFPSKFRLSTSYRQHFPTFPLEPFNSFLFSRLVLVLTNITATNQQQQQLGYYNGKKASMEANNRWQQQYNPDYTLKRKIDNARKGNIGRGFH